MNDIEIQVLIYLFVKGTKISKSFTGFTIAIRYIFFVLSILAAFLYIRKYKKIPVTDRIIEQKLIGILSIFLIFFNDPLYPITVLKENMARYLFFKLVHFSQHYLWYLLSCIWFSCGSYFMTEFTTKKEEKIQIRSNCTKLSLQWYYSSCWWYCTCCTQLIDWTIIPWFQVRGWMIELYSFLMFWFQFVLESLCSIFYIDTLVSVAIRSKDFGEVNFLWLTPYFSCWQW